MFYWLDNTLYDLFLSCCHRCICLCIQLCVRQSSIFPLEFWATDSYLCRLKFAHHEFEQLKVLVICAIVIATLKLDSTIVWMKRRLLLLLVSCSTFFTEIHINPLPVCTLDLCLYYYKMFLEWKFQCVKCLVGAIITNLTCKWSSVNWCVTIYRNLKIKPRQPQLADRWQKKKSFVFCGFVQVIWK